MKVVALAPLALTLTLAPSFAQNFSSEDLARRTIERRAVEAVIWGMPAVNFDLLYQAMAEAKGGWNEMVYWSRMPDWKNQTLTPNPDTIYLFRSSTRRKSGRSFSRYSGGLVLSLSLVPTFAQRPAKARPSVKMASL